MAVARPEAFDERATPLFDTVQVRLAKNSPDNLPTRRQRFTAMAMGGTLVGGIAISLLIDPANRGDLLLWLILAATMGVFIWQWASWRNERLGFLRFRLYPEGILVVLPVLDGIFHRKRFVPFQEIRRIVFEKHRASEARASWMIEATDGKELAFGGIETFVIRALEGALQDLKPELVEVVSSIG